MSEERTIWGIHMEWHHGLKPVEQGYISIGWPALGNLAEIPNDREAFKGALAKAYPNSKPGAVPVIAGTLFRFSNEIAIGDLVVYPSKPNRMVNLGTVESSYTFDPRFDEQYPNRHKVRWIKHIPQAEFSQAALHEIGSAVTLFQVKNNADEFLSAFEGKLVPSVDVDEETAGAASEATEESTRDFVIKNLKSKLDPYQFEHFVGHLLERMGYYARVTQKSGDSGVDIIAHKDVLGFEPPIIKVQCKQVLSSIGQPDVAQLYGHVQHAEHGLFITLGEFTAQARQFERGKHNLRLINGEELVELIFTHYGEFEPRYQILLPLKKVYIPGVVSAEISGD
jgi:restriction system protein